MTDFYSIFIYYYFSKSLKIHLGNYKDPDDKFRNNSTKVEF